MIKLLVTDSPISGALLAEITETAPLCFVVKQDHSDITGDFANLPLLSRNNCLNAWPVSILENSLIEENLQERKLDFVPHSQSPRSAHINGYSLLSPVFIFLSFP